VIHGEAQRAVEALSWLTDERAHASREQLAEAEAQLAQVVDDAKPQRSLPFPSLLNPVPH
jgi:hypothetical protein